TLLKLPHPIFSALSIKHLYLLSFPTRRSSDLRELRSPRLARSGRGHQARQHGGVVGEPALHGIETRAHARRPLRASLDSMQRGRSEEHTSELQSRGQLVRRLLPE